MSDLEGTIKLIQLAITGAEALAEAIAKAKKDLDDSTASLKDVLAQAVSERDAMHAKLAEDRKEADADFDHKFDTSGDKST
jgi:hypothetical protein